MNASFDITESSIIKDVWIIQPSVTEDERGNIWTSFLQGKIEKLLPEGLCFKHDKFSHSKKNVIRGIHGDYKTWKLVTCVFGDIYQVVVDLRKESTSLNKYESFLLSGDNHIGILIPPGLGNALLVTSHIAVYHYKLAYRGSYVSEKAQFSHKWNDPRFNIIWPINDPILSDRDK